jgi:hypothetical protein
MKKAVRFVVEVWVTEDSQFVAVANALHIEDAEATSTAPTPGEAAKVALDELIDKEAE